MIKTLINRASSPKARFVFAHGAGAGLESDFMETMATALSKHNIEVVRFNFAYMELAQTLGKRRPPDRAPKLLNHFEQVLQELKGDLPLFIGGKSMGGRMASLLLAESPAIAAICMGYPFHPPGKLDKLRTEHLKDMSKPILILQGERDTFGKPEEISGYELSETIQIEYLVDGDHSFKPRKSSGVTLEQNLQQAVNTCSEFIQRNID